MAPSPIPPTHLSRFIPPGEQVEVRCRYDGRWVDGFAVAEPVAEGYRVRRALDGLVLPDPFRPEDVRPAPSA